MSEGEPETDELLEQDIMQAVLLEGMLTHSAYHPRYNTVLKEVMEPNSQPRYCCEISIRIHPSKLTFHHEQLVQVAE